MNKWIATLIGVLFSTSVWAQVKELPNTPIKDVQTGKKLAFNEVVKPGRVTVVSFWATWCVPCKKEIKNVRNKLGGWKEETDFDFITVSIDESRSEGLVRSYAKSQGWEFPYYIDNNSDLKRSLNFQTVPYTIIVDRGGNIAFSHTGYEEGSEDAMYARVKELAGK